MKNSILIQLSLCVVVALTSCSPKYYVPNTQNVPLLRERGDLSLNACGNTNQLEVQGAFALTNKLGVMANGAFFIPKDESNGSGGKGSIGEVGVGYFLPFAKFMVFEAYGLVGFGNVQNYMPVTVTTYPTTDGKINANLLRFGIQPNIGFKSKYFHAAISSRFVSVNFSNINGSLMFNDVDQAAYLKSNKSLFIAEPAITLRGGIEKVKVQVQLAGSYNLTKSNFLQETSLLSVGLHVGL